MLTTTEKTAKGSLQILDCGLAPYPDVLARQLRLHRQRIQNIIPNTVLITEHPPVITLGARQSANKLLTSPDDLRRQRIEVIEIRRGGGTTAHNPGQLVLYPILHLRQLGLTITEYIRTLEQIGIELLTQLGISAERRKEFPGLWVKHNRQFRKIASIGVRVSKSVTYHGMAINIHNDLTIFEFIIPCGIDDVEMTSVLIETGKRHSINQIKQKLSQLLIKHLSIPNELRATSHERRKLPPWLHRTLPAGPDYTRIDNILSSLKLQTICYNANCPNRGICWDRATVAVLLLGNICTRNCGFCSVSHGKPAPPDTTEPHRLAEMASRIGLKYLVITSVNRDDLPDGGAGHFRDCIKAVRQRCPDIKFEILTPDFRNCQAQAIRTLLPALPFVFAHNIETVPALYPLARPASSYQSSLNLLKMAKQTYGNVQTKSSIMLGLGETDEQIEQVLKDLRNVGCDRITIGQYLKPSKDSLDVTEYITPEKFDFWGQKARQFGFCWVQSSPFARSSYLAEQQNT